MTNEELAVAIKAGRSDLIPDLWGQCVGFIRLQASRWAQAWSGKRFDFDYEDFVQAGYFALLQAVEKWEPGRGYAFIGFLDMCLKTAFSEVAGCRTMAQKQEVIYKASRLESPVPGNQAADNGKILADIIGGDCEELEAIDEADYREYIARTVRAIVASLPERRRQTIEQHYLHGVSYAAIAADMGVSQSRVQHIATEGLRQIRQSQEGEKLRRLYFGCTSPYKGSGLASWRATGSSKPEREVIKLDNIQRRYQLNTRAGKVAFCVHELGFSQEQAERIFPE